MALVAITCLFVFGASAYTGTQYGSTGIYYYSFSSGEVTITDADSSITTANIPSTINGYPVTSIGSGAFSGCSKLTSITIPNNVTSIGYSAFRECSGLTSITIPNSVTSIVYDAFYNCSSLASISIADSVANIGVHAFCGTAYYYNPNNWKDGLLYIDNHLIEVKNDIIFASIKSGTITIADEAFYNCSKLTEVTIPDSISNIGSCAFYSCSSLTSITIPDSVKNIGVSAFFNTSIKNFVVPKGVKTIGMWFTYLDFDPIYFGNVTLESIVIPEGVTSISNHAFHDCKGLKYINLPDSIIDIGESAFFGTSIEELIVPKDIKSIGMWFSFDDNWKRTFYGNGKLKSIIIKDGATEISKNAFYECTGLTSITIPNSVTSIGKYAFERCSKLTKVNITDLKAWCEIKFDYSSSNPLYYAHNLYLNDKLITDLVIPNSVTSIGSGAFEYCSGLTSVSIGNSVISIGSGAFSECTGLTSVTIGNSVTSIGSYAFYECIKLTSITIPNSVTSIRDYAFSGCNNVNSIKFNGAPPTLSKYSFSKVSCKVFYPYKVDGWKSTIKSTYGGNINWVVYSNGVLNNLEILSLPNIKYYNLGDYINFYGLKLEATWSDGLVETLTNTTAQSEELKYSKTVADKIGKNTVKITYHGKSVSYKIDVHDLENINVDKSMYPESSHNYKNNITETKTFSYLDAVSYSVKFSSKTFVEKDGDYIYVNGIKYTGSELAGKTLDINNSKITIKLKSDDYDNYYGYSIDKIVAVVPVHLYKDNVVKSTLSTNGKITPTCSVCGAKKTATVIAYPKTIALSSTKATYTGKAIKPTVTVTDSKGKAVANTNYTVTYASNTNAGTATVTITFKGNYSGTKTLNFTIAPKQVTGLKASAETTTSLKLTWSKTDGAKYYKVEQSTDGKTWKVITTTDKLTYTVKSLKAGTKYQFRVTALDSTKKIAGKASAVLKTGTLTAAPTIKLASTKKATATVTITKVTGASKYTIYKSTDNKKWTKVGDTTKLTYDLTKLTAGKKIYVKVVAVNAYGKASAYSSVKNVTVKK